MVPVPTRKISCRLTVTYAGFSGESALLEDLYERGLAQPEIGPDLHAGNGCLMYWTHEPQAPWQTPEWLEQMRASLRPNQYLRMIENRFVTSEETFISLALWDACATGRQVVADASMPVWIGVDASTKRDSTAIAVVTWERENKRARLVWHRIFQPSPDSPLDFEATIEQTLLELKHRFAVRGVYYDPYQMQSVSQRLTRRGLNMVEFPQTVPNLTASSSNLYELIKSQGLVVYPDDDDPPGREPRRRARDQPRLAHRQRESFAQDRHRRGLGAGRLRRGVEGRERLHENGDVQPIQWRWQGSLEGRAAQAARPRRVVHAGGGARPERKGTMVMVAIGDIVEIRQFPKRRWAVLGPYSHDVPPGRRWQLRSGR